jgi:hypothetical protein
VTAAPNYARAKQQARTRQHLWDNPDDGRDTSPRRPQRPLGRGWRTEYPETFPVLISHVSAPTPADSSPPQILRGQAA